MIKIKVEKLANGMLKLVDNYKEIIYVHRTNIKLSEIEGSYRLILVDSSNIITRQSYEDILEVLLGE